VAAKDKLLLHHKKITLFIVVASLVASFLTPIEQTISRLAEFAPGVLLAVGVTEALFVLGLVIMAGTVGFELGPNPLKWKQHFVRVVRHLPADKWFWAGFWVNAAGALGTGIVLAWAVVKALPPQSWGLIWVPFLDLGITVFIRATILELKREFQEK
jgi:hypothetical protein